MPYTRPSANELASRPLEKLETKSNSPEASPNLSLGNLQHATLARRRSTLGCSRRLHHNFFRIANFRARTRLGCLADHLANCCSNLLPLDDFRGWEQPRVLVELVEVELVLSFEHAIMCANFLDTLRRYLRHPVAVLVRFVFGCLEGWPVLPNGKCVFVPALFDM